MSDQERKQFDEWRERFIAEHGLMPTEADAWQARAALAQQAVPPAPTLSKEALTQKIADMLAGTYHCGRVWQAWSYGTMGPGDFSDVAESDTPAEIADEVIAMLAAATAAPQASQGAAVVDGKNDAGDAAWAAAKRLANKSEQDFIRGAQWAMQREASKTVTVSKPDARIRAKVHPPVQPNGEAEAAPQAEQQAVPSDDEIVQDGRVFADNCEYLDGRCVRLDFTPRRLVAFVRAALAAQQAEREPLTAVQRTAAFGESDLNDCSPQIDVWHAACAWTERAHGIGHHVPVQGSEQ